MHRSLRAWPVLLLLSGCGSESEPESEPGSSTTSAAGSASETASETGSGAGTNPGSGPGPDSGADTSSGAGTESEADSAPDPDPDPETGQPASSALSDEFDDPSTLANWRQWHQVAEVEPRHDLLDIDLTNPGMLTVRPRTSGWFGDYEGPLLYKMIEGDFVIEAWVAASKIGDPSAPPDEQFNSVGLLARDPVTGEGQANWIMASLGRQEGVRVASEGKTTVDSQSVLELIDGPRRGRLRICRVGSRFVIARRLEGEGAFMETQSYDRPDLPDTLQVGMVATGWNSSVPQPDFSRTPDIEGTIDYVHFSAPASEADCTAE